MNPLTDSTHIAVTDDDEAIANDLLKYLLEQPPALQLALLQFHIGMLRASQEERIAGTLFH